MSAAADETGLVLILGAGGHGREIAEILRAARSQGQPYEPFGFIEVEQSLWGTDVDGLPVLGDLDWLRRPEASGRRFLAIPAIGSPAATARLARQIESWNLECAQAISPNAVVSERASLGRGLNVFPGTFVSSRARLGDFCSLNVGVSVSHDAEVGACAILGPGARLAGGARVGNGCWLGMGAQVLPNRTVGAGSIIGAGAVVVRDLPPGVTAVGVPARIIKGLG